MYQASTSRTRAHTAADSESVGEAYHDAALVTTPRCHRDGRFKRRATGDHYELPRAAG